MISKPWMGWSAARLAVPFVLLERFPVEQTAVSKTIRRKKNSDAEAGYQKTEAQDAARLARFDARQNLRSRAERLAGDHLCVMNWRFPEAADHFPVEPWMRSVTKYFRDAVGGPLAIDEPEAGYQLDRARIREPILRKLGKKYGFRYVILEPNKHESDDIMELEKCG